MPYRRRNYRRRRRSSRKGWWKRKQRRYAGRGSTGIRFFKIRKTQTLASDSLGGMELFSNNGPHTGFQEWTSISALFDTYRAAAIKVKFIPQLPNDASTLTGYHPLYVFGDKDATVMPVTTVNEAIQYENMKPKNMFAPWKYYFRCGKLSGVGNAANVRVNIGGWIDAATPFGHAAICGIGTGFDTSQTYGTLVWTLYLMAKNRR